MSRGYFVRYCSLPADGPEDSTPFPKTSIWIERTRQKHIVQLQDFLPFSDIFEIPCRCSYAAFATGSDCLRAVAPGLAAVRIANNISFSRISHCQTPGPIHIRQWLVPPCTNAYHPLMKVSPSSRPSTRKKLRFTTLALTGLPPHHLHEPRS